MPNLQSIVLTDRATTPVNYTLLPVKEEDGVGFVAVADATGAAISEKRMSIGQRRSGTRIRNTLKFRFPVVVVETINGVQVPTVAREAFVDMTFNFADTSTEAERNDVVGMVSSALATTKALVNDTVVKNQSIW